jgi:demethylmenaquinone methyltransferase/2-methoxy-6-polyprenyl-1,4-benzoquinol methylase
MQYESTPENEWRLPPKKMPEVTNTIRLLRLTDRLRRPALVSAAEALALPAGSHGLDAGCGIGSHTDLLLEATSPDSRVTGLDFSEEHLDLAEESAREKGLADRTEFHLGRVESLPFESGFFDWVWSVDCVGFIPGDSPGLVRELARVVRPGGTVAVVLWSSQLLLPGYPFLEARLNATRAGAAPASADSPPHRHFLRSLGFLAEAGLENPSVRTFPVDLQAPFNDFDREAIAGIFEMRWGHPESELSSADGELYRKLTDWESGDAIIDADDYFGFFTYTIFWGGIPS